MDDTLWTAVDVARYLRASRSWVYQRAEAGDLPSLQLGGLLRFEPEVVRAFARGECVATGRVISLSTPPRKRPPRKVLDT